MDPDQTSVLPAPKAQPATGDRIQTLASRFFQKSGNLADKWEQYLSIYEVELAPYIHKGEAISLLEIGVQNGGSLQFWSEYLPAGSRIVGIDIDPKVSKIASPDSGISLIIHDASDGENLRPLLGNSAFDIIIDDGSHICKDVIDAFMFFFDYLAPGGRYIIEDLHTSYWQTHGGGFLEAHSSIEWLKSLVDVLHADHIQPEANISEEHRYFLQTMNALVARTAFYDSVAVVEKLRAEKVRPYRRVFGGVETPVVPFESWIFKTPPESLGTLIFAHPAARRVEACLVSELSTRRACIEQLSAAAKQAEDREAAHASRIAELSDRLQALEIDLAAKNADIETTSEQTGRDAFRIKALELELAAKSAEVREMSAQTVRSTFRIKALIASRKLADRTTDRLDAHAADLEAQLATVSRSRLLRGAALMRRVLSRRRQPGVIQLAALAETRAKLKEFSEADAEVLIETGVIDVSHYRASYHDVDRSGADVARHYLDVGSAEGRQPYAGFDPLRYQTHYEDVAKEGIPALIHYVLHGASEGRDALAPGGALSPTADTSAFDPSPAWSSNEQANALIASGLFDPNWYLASYSDVSKSGMEALEHFIEHGWKEWRRPNVLFDPTWYVQAYSDVSDAGIDPLFHFIQHGADEGRSPSADFDTSWYRSQHPDISKSGANPLAHYLREGKEQGWPALDPNGIYAISVIDDVQRLRIEWGELVRHIAMMSIKPRFLLFVEGEDEAGRRATTESVGRQIYTHLELVEDLGAIRSVRNLPAGNLDFLVWLQAGDVLSDRALYEFASLINAEPNVDLIYADEDVMGPLGRHTPFFKPAWSPDTLESFNYIGPGACFRLMVAAEPLAEASGLYDFVLRFTERCSAVHHIRQVLCHRTRSPADRVLAEQNGDAAALQARLMRTGRTGKVEPVAPGYSCLDARIALRSEPLISVVIPTAGMTVEIDGRPVDLLMHCLDTIQQRSSYKNLEFIVVDNGDLGGNRERNLRRRGVKRLTYTDPVFNIPKKLNMGAAAASGELLLLLNDDVEPLNADWIERLVEHFEKPHVGVVGSKLLYTNHTTQHVGVVTNNGCPDHVRRLRPRDEQGYFFSTCGTRNYIAVTGACMMTPAALYRQVGGYTEALAVSYNDADYCLKVGEISRFTVYAPRSELLHYESRSRVPRLDMSEQVYFMKRWATKTTFDPYYNERRLSVASPTFEVRNNARLIG